MPWCSHEFSFSINIFALLLCTTVFKNTSASKHLANVVVLQIVIESKSELQRLRQKLAADDKVAVDVPPDSNCLFASLAHQLQRSDVPNVHSEMVQYIAHCTTQGRV